MGWLLTSKPKKTRPARKPKPAASRDRRPWDPQRTLWGLRCLGVVILLIGLGFGWREAERYLVRYATANGPVIHEAQDVVLADQPDWMNVLPQLAPDLKQLVARQIGREPLQNDGLERAVQVLADSPWVQRIDRVQRMVDGRVEVRAQYRQPIALVRGEDGYHRPVDAQAVLLPGKYVDDQAQGLGWPVIVGATIPPGEVGGAWPGSDLQAGLSLVRLLADQAYVDQVVAVDVSARDSRGRLRLVLHTRQGMVRWGLPPGMEQSIEPDPATKLRRLAEVNHRLRAIDAGGKVVDIFGADVFIHQSTVRQSTQRALEPAASSYRWAR